MKRSSVVGFTIVMLAWVAAACGPTLGGIEPIVEAQPTPVVTVNNNNPNAEEIQTIQLDNCDGKGDSKRTEVRTQSIDAEISAGLAAQIGADAGVVQGAIQVAVGTALTAGSERSSSIELAAPPGTHMEIQLVWTGEEQVGVVQNILGSDVPIAFRSFSPTDVRIKSQYDIGCSTPLPNTEQDIVPSEPDSQEPAPDDGSMQPQGSSEEESTVPPADDPLAQATFRERFAASIGTGPLSATSFSDGLAEYTADYLAANKGRLQMMNIVSTPTGCATAFYGSERIWFGSTRPTKIMINGQLVAEYTQPGDFRGNHGSIFDWKVNIGDEVCVEMTPEIQFHLIFGPDVDIHYDSYCFRGFC